jgi:hypothetical protein
MSNESGLRIDYHSFGFDFLFLAVQRFELTAMHLLGRYSIT